MKRFCKQSNGNFQLPLQAGVTLVEVLVVIAIVAILAGIALPSYQRTIERNRLVAAGEELKGALQLARMEALKNTADVEFDTENGNAGTWCYGFGSLTCAAATSGNKHPTVDLSASSDFIFDGRRATANKAAIYTFETENLKLDVSVATSGRISISDPEDI